MKKALAFILIFSGCFQLLYAQKKTDQPSLSQVLTPSPNASELTKYSGIPVSLSSGSASLNIPLGDITSGSLSVPVSFNYNSGNGVRIEELASRAGVSWILNAGGVITRVLSDEPDESSRWLAPIENVKSYSAESQSYLDKSTTMDTQPDIFSFNFNGYNGKFILDPNDKTKVIFLPVSNLKVTLNFSGEITGDWTFRITDPNGVNYYFGGSKGTEKSKNSPLSGKCIKNFDQPLENAWYLKRIEHYNGEWIQFDYNRCAYNYMSGINQIITKTKFVNYLECAKTACPTINDVSTCAASLSSTGVILKSITSPNAQISFSYKERKDISRDSLISGIRFYAKMGSDMGTLRLTKDFTINYQDSYNNSYFNFLPDTNLMTRPFLSEIIQNGDGTDNLPPLKHTFDYYDINKLPSRLSYAQDHWGYFNGKNNSSFVPRLEEQYDIMKLFPEATANRSPDGNFSMYGLLKQVTYPTGGKVTIEYEPNLIWEPREVLGAPISVNKSITGVGMRGAVVDNYTLKLGAYQQIPFSFSCGGTGIGMDDRIHQNANLKITDNSTNIAVYSKNLLIGDYVNEFVYLPTGIYTVKLTVSGEAATGGYNMNYREDPSTVEANYQTGGVRVKSTFADSKNSLPVIKKYYYTGLFNQKRSTGILNTPHIDGAYYSDVTNYSPCELTLDHCNYSTAQSSSWASAGFNSGRHIFYRTVIETDDDQWANGGIEHEFDADKSMPGEFIRGEAIRPLQNGNNGSEQEREISTLYFSKTGGTPGNYTYRKVKQVLTNYKNDSRVSRTIDAYVIRKNYFTTNQPLYAMSYDVTSYKVTSGWLYPDTVVTQEFDVNGNVIINNKVVSSYENISHQLITKRELLFNKNERKTEVMKYPHEMVAGGINIPYQDMIANNVISPIVEHQVYVNNVFTEATQNNYKDWGNQVFKPQNIKTKTAPVSADYETRIEFQDYTMDGRLKSQSPYKGAKTSYVWGYNGQVPIAEIKNADYGMVESAAGGAKALADFSALSNPGTAELTNFLKLLRSGLPTALITVFTYDPLMRMTSQTDPKGQTMYYEYDGFQRLKNVKDQQGNIIKNNTYHYKN